MDRSTHALLDALKTAAQQRGDHRLYKRGKLPGLFSRADIELANQAIADGLIEITRVETVGKNAVEWVQITPKGLDTLIQSDSPRQALEELRELLAVNQEGYAKWVAELNAQIRAHVQRYADEVSAMRARLDHLARRVEEALGDFAADRTPTPSPSADWEQEALAFLERRRHVGLEARSPLGELFEWLKQRQPELTIKDFHTGVKRLEESREVTLSPSAGPGDTPTPEYALLIGATVYYYVASVK